MKKNYGLLMSVAFGLVALTSGMQAASTALADQYLEQGGSVKAFLEKKQPGFGKTTKAGTVFSVSTNAILKEFLASVNAKLTDASDEAVVNKLSKAGEEAAAMAQKFAPNASWAVAAKVAVSVAKLNGAENTGDADLKDKADAEALARIKANEQAGASDLKNAAGNALAGEDLAAQLKKAQEAVVAQREVVRSFENQRCVNVEVWGKFKEADGKLTQLLEERDQLQKQAEALVSQNVAKAEKGVEAIATTAQSAQQAPEGSGVWNWMKQKGSDAVSAVTNAGWLVKGALVGGALVAGSAATNKLTGYGLSLGEIAEKMTSVGAGMSPYLPEANLKNGMIALGALAVVIGSKVTYDSIYPGEKAVKEALTGEAGKQLEASAAAVAKDPKAQQSAQVLQSAIVDVGALLAAKGNILKTVDDLIAQKPEGWGDKAKAECEKLVELDAKMDVARRTLKRAQKSFSSYAVNALQVAGGIGVATAVAYLFARVAGMTEMNARQFVEAGMGAVTARIGTAAAWVQSLVWKSANDTSKSWYEIPLYSYGPPLEQKPWFKAITGLFKGNWTVAAAAL